MTYSSYTPEMNETRPTDAVADVEYFYGHYYVNTALEVSGRGIKNTDHLTLMGNHKDGEHCYEMTPKAFEKFSAEHKVTKCLHLD